MGVEKDLEKAAELMLEAGKSGYALAQFKLVQIYWQGIGVEKNDATAFTWAGATSCGRLM